MKINPKLFFSIFITTISATSAANSNNNNSNSFKGFPYACKNEMLRVEKCMSREITKRNLNTICTAAKTTICQKFYSDPMSVVPSCINFKSLISTSARVFNNSLSLMCETDERGNLCPLTEYEISVNNNSHNTIINDNSLKAIRNTCASAKCTKATKNYIQYLLNNNSSILQIVSTNYRFSSIEDANKEVVNSLSTFMKILNGNNCKPNKIKNTIAKNSPVFLTSVNNNQAVTTRIKSNPIVTPVKGANHNPTVIPAINNRPTVVPNINNSPTVVPNINNTPTVVPNINNSPTVVPDVINNPTVVSGINSYPTVLPDVNSNSEIASESNINKTQTQDEKKELSLKEYIGKISFFIFYLIIYCLTFKYFLL